MTSIEISIHAPREGSDFEAAFGAAHILISIHAPREGSDLFVLQLKMVNIISIHAPREGSDPVERLVIDVFQFQSTLPVKGATLYQR